MASFLPFAALMLAPPAEPVALDDLIVFADRSRCAPAADFGRVLDGLWEFHGDRVKFLAAVPQPYRPAFGTIMAIRGNTGGALITIEMNATWHGLPLLFVTMDETKRHGVKLQLHVLASAKRTRSTLRPLGFRFGADDNVPYPAVELETHEPASTVLSCTLRHG